MGTMVSQITSLTIVYSTVYSGADPTKHQSSASLAFVRGIHRWALNSPHKGPATRKMFPFDDVFMMFLITKQMVHILNVPFHTEETVTSLGKFLFAISFSSIHVYSTVTDLIYYIFCIPFAAKLRLTKKPSVNLIHPFDPDCLIIHCCPIILSNLTRWGRVTHICVGEQTIIGSDNGLSPGRRQAITRTNAGILSIEPWGTNFSEILIEIHTFSFQKMHLKMPSVKWRPSCLGLISICASPRKQTDT